MAAGKVEAKLVEAGGEPGEKPRYRGFAFSADTVDIVVVTQWREVWGAYHECCMFWRGPHNPDWECIEQSHLPDALRDPLGWVKEYPGFAELFEPFGRWK